ncbi:MAG: GNAT family N-acetyltransferase [Thermomicrobiales bacterium]
MTSCAPGSMRGNGSGPDHGRRLRASWQWIACRTRSVSLPISTAFPRASCQLFRRLARIRQATISSRASCGGSSQLVLAVDDDADGRVVGFITAISDGVLSAYIPLLEVLPEWQHRGIGSDLVQRMLDQLEPLYMIDLCCDDEMMPFYDRFGFTRGRSMLKRSYPHQAGRAIDGGTHADD